jgi:hypothetical protein
LGSFSNNKGHFSWNHRSFRDLYYTTLPLISSVQAAVPNKQERMVLSMPARKNFCCWSGQFVLLIVLAVAFFVAAAEGVLWLLRPSRCGVPAANKL